MSQPKPHYEAGMKVVYDPQSRRVVVNFRARVQVLPESYDSEPEAVAAGERLCRELGWQPREGARSQGQLHSPWGR